MMKVIRLVNIHNEEDILERNLKWYIDQNINTLAINNSSTDNSKDILNSMIGKGVIEVVNLDTEYFNRSALFTKITELGHKYEPDWIIFADADEFLEPLSKKHYDLNDMIYEVSLEGNNLIQFHNMEFWMTTNDPASLKDPLNRIKYYSYFDSNRYKVFKFYKGFSLLQKYGHAPTFPKEVPIKLSMHKGISRHYKFRSIDQARYKIDRVIPEPGKKDFGFHYAKFGKEEKWFVIEPSRLNLYQDDKNWNFERKFNGNRMSDCELSLYLGFNGIQELREWIDNKGNL